MLLKPAFVQPINEEIRPFVGEFNARKYGNADFLSFPDSSLKIRKIKVELFLIRKCLYGRADIPIQKMICDK